MSIQEFSDMLLNDLIYGCDGEHKECWRCINCIGRIEDDTLCAKGYKEAKKMESLG